MSQDPFELPQEELAPERQRVPLSQGEFVAEKFVERFGAFCSRIRAAGSIRRQIRTVKDVETVAIKIGTRTRQS